MAHTIESVSALRMAVVPLSLGAALLVGCSDSVPDTNAGQTSASSAETPSNGQQFPDVIEVQVTRDGDDAFSFDVTISSPYDSADRYADGWRIVGPDGQVFGEMTLDHDHASEQPFTRSQPGVEIPSGVTMVTVEGRDTQNGYGGRTQTVELPAS